jgi:hypothetical protein
MWKQEVYEIVHNYNGSVAAVKVDGIVNGKIGIHHSIDGVSVTHIPTGLRLGPPLPSLGQAFRFANSLCVSLPLPDTLKELERIKEDIGRVRYATQQS